VFKANSKKDKITRCQLNFKFENQTNLKYELFEAYLDIKTIICTIASIPATYQLSDKLSTGL
jgi:hypothetical protein